MTKNHTKTVAYTGDRVSDPVVFSCIIFLISLGPDPVFKFFWIRIWFQPPQNLEQKSAERAQKVFFYICIMPGKKFMNDGNQKLHMPFRRIFPLLLVWFCQFYIVFCHFASFLAPQRRQPVAGMPTFFPGMLCICKTFAYVTINSCICKIWLQMHGCTAAYSRRFNLHMPPFLFKNAYYVFDTHRNSNHNVFWTQ